jgi:hypothetical protein
VTLHLSLKRIFALLLCATMASNAMAETDTGHIDLSLVKYSSDFERTQFLNLRDKGIFNRLNFLLCLDSTANDAKAQSVLLKFNRFFNEKLAPIQKSKTGDKAIKAVFKEIHDNLLTKYITEAHFEMILDDGRYNCLTASALYALSFEKLGIPYQLRSTADHVYVIANPGPEQILIETTDPVGGAFTYNEQYKKAYIEMLQKQKMISKQEFNESSLETLFQKYFYSSDTINLKQLIGYHYYNSGVELIRDENYEKASNQLMKAYYLNDKKQVAHMLSLGLAVLINKNFDIADSASMNLYFLFCSLNEEVDYEFLYNKYVFGSEDLLMRKDELDKFQKISGYIFHFIKDSTQLSKFQEHYYYACAVSYYSKKDFISAYQNIAKSYCLNSKNLRVKSMFEDLNSNLFRYFPKDDDGLLDSAINTIWAAGSNCEQLNSSKWKFQMMMMRAGLEFQNNRMESGNQILAEAEKFAADNKLTDFEDRYIQMAYGGAKNYYYVRYDIPKAKEYLARGLKLDPNNQYLKDDLEALNKLGNWTKPTGSYRDFPLPSTAPRVKNYTATPRTVIVKTPH